MISTLVDGRTRTAIVRGPATARDAVIVAHAWHLDATGMLAHWPSGLDHLDVAPQGLPTPDGPSWAVPGMSGLPGYPTGVRDDSDVRYMASLADQVHATYPSVRRLWWAGPSSGGLLGWACLQARLPFEGYFVSQCPEPTTFAFAPPVMRPFCDLHGSIDHVHEQLLHSKAWAATWIDLKRVAGATGQSSWRRVGMLEGLPLVRMDGIGGIPVRRLVRQGGEHKWAVGAGDLAVDWFRTHGMGT